MPPVLKTEVMPSLLEVELKLKSIKPADGTLNLSPFYRRKDNCSVDLQRRRPLENDTCLCIDFWTRSVKRFARSWESRWQHCTEISTKPTTINLLYNSVPPRIINKSDFPWAEMRRWPNWRRFCEEKGANHFVIANNFVVIFWCSRFIFNLSVPFLYKSDDSEC